MRVLYNYVSKVCHPRSVADTVLAFSDPPAAHCRGHFIAKFQYCTVHCFASIVVLYGTLRILRFVGKSVGIVSLGLQHLTRSRISCTV